MGKQVLFISDFVTGITTDIKCKYLFIIIILFIFCFCYNAAKNKNKGVSMIEEKDQKSNLEGKQPNIYLYIPFTSDEDPAEIYAMATKWCLHVSQSAKKHKTPQIVMHRKDYQKDEDFVDYKNIIFRFNGKEVPKNSVIYILGHGTLTSHFVSNKIHGFRLSIGEIAVRLKHDGFTAEAATHFKALRLFFCNKKEETKLLSINFAKALGEKYRNTYIDFYTLSVGFPDVPNDPNEVTRKRAAFRRVEEGQTVFKLVGRASEYKKTLKVGDYLSPDITESKTKPATFCMWPRLFSLLTSCTRTTVSENKISSPKISKFA